MITKKHVVDLFLTFETRFNEFFDAHLYRLIARADFMNRGKLEMSFPGHVETYLEWYETDTSKDFWDKYLTKQEQEDLRNRVQIKY